MTYLEAVKYAKQGKLLLLPGWQGQFMWDYSNNKLIFKNGDYILNSEQLQQFNLDNRNDWYYII